MSYTSSYYLRFKTRGFSLALSPVVNVAAGTALSLASTPALSLAVSTAASLSASMILSLVFNFDCLPHHRPGSLTRPGIISLTRLSIGSLSSSLCLASILTSHFHESVAIDVSA